MSNVDKPKAKRKGLNVAGAVSFIVGDIVGSGILTLPYTMQLISWWGVPLFFGCSILMCFCGTLLSQGYMIVFGNVTDRELIRDPYPQLAERAFGFKAKTLVIIILNVSLLFACIVFILLLGEVATQIAPLPTNKLSHRIQLRLWFVLGGVALLPFTFLGTPKDFWAVGPLSSICSALAAVLVLLNIFIVGHRDGFTVPTKLAIQPEVILAIIGTIQFTFGGLSIFPTIQNDLNEPEKFPSAIYIGYCIVFVLYTGVSVSAFVILDGKIQEDVLTTFIGMPIYNSCLYFRTYVTLAQAMVCGHIFCAFIMVINPLNLQIEALLNVPIHFSWQRIVIRSATVIVVVSISTVVPNFGPVLSLAGGTLFTLLNVIFPLLFFQQLAPDMHLTKALLLVGIMLMAVASSIGNGIIELKNVFKVVQGKYE